MQQLVDTKEAQLELVRSNYEAQLEVLRSSYEAQLETLRKQLQGTKDAHKEMMKDMLKTKEEELEIYKNMSQAGNNSYKPDVQTPRRDMGHQLSALSKKSQQAEGIGGGSDTCMASLGSSTVALANFTTAPKEDGLLDNTSSVTFEETQWEILRTFLGKLTERNDKFLCGAEGNQQEEPQEEAKSVSSENAQKHTANAYRQQTLQKVLGLTAKLFAKHVTHLPSVAVVDVYEMLQQEMKSSSLKL